MNLDGLNASYEIDIKNNYHQKQIIIIFPKQLNGKRGIYVIHLSDYQTVHMLDV